MDRRIKALEDRIDALEKATPESQPAERSACLGAAATAADEYIKMNGGKESIGPGGKAIWRARQTVIDLSQKVYQNEVARCQLLHGSGR